jgi:Fructose-2,6-bisphosphatase
MRFMIVRHGQTAWNQQRKIQGITDIPLNDVGRFQVRCLAEYIKKHYRVDAVYSSPLKRARETAQICAEPFDIPVQLTDELREIRLGDWEGLTFDEIQRTHPKELELWEKEPHVCVIPGDSETISDIAIRLRGLIERLKELHESNNETVLCITHHTPARLIIADSMGLGIKGMSHLRINNASLNVFDWTPDQTLLYTLNERCYMDALSEEESCKTSW